MPKQNIAERILRQGNDTTKAKKMSEDQFKPDTEEKLTAIKENLSSQQRSVLTKCKEKLPFMSENDILNICLKHDFNMIIVDSIVEGLIKRSQEADDGDWMMVGENAPKKPTYTHNENRGKKFRKYENSDNQKPMGKKFNNNKERKPENKNFKPKVKNFVEPKWIQKDDEQKGGNISNDDAPLQKNIEKLLEEDSPKKPEPNANIKVQANGPEKLPEQEETKYSLIKKPNYETPKKKSHEMIKESSSRKQSENKQTNQVKLDMAMLVLANGKTLPVLLPEGFSDTMDAMNNPVSLK